MAIHRMFVFLGGFVLLAQQAMAQVIPATTTAPGATTPATTPAAPAATAPTACAASFGVFGPSGSSAPSSPSPTTNVSVQQTNSAASSSSTQASSGTTPTGVLKVIQLTNPTLNAADLAAALQGKIAGITNLVPIGAHDLLYAIDPSKVTGPSAPGKSPISFHVQATDANGQTTLATISFQVLAKKSGAAVITPRLPPATVDTAYAGHKLLAYKIPEAVWTLKEVPVDGPKDLKIDSDGMVHFTPEAEGEINFTVNVHGGKGGKSISQEIKIAVLKQSAELKVTSTELPDAIPGTPYIAVLDSIGGFGSVSWKSSDLPKSASLATNGSVTIVNPSSPAPTPAKVTAESVDAQFRSLLEELPALPLSLPEVIGLPDGSVGACAIITMIGHQVDGVASLAAISDTRIMVRYATDSDVIAARNKLKELITGLAISIVPPAPQVQSVTMRLYYDRNATSVASAVGTAFSQLKVAAVSMNPTNSYTDLIVLADPTGVNSRDTLDRAQRMIALLDEPRAQVVVNAWSLQVASDKQNKTSQLVPEARRLAAGYNNALELAVMRGWNFLNDPHESAGDDNPIKLDPVFSGYLCRSFRYRLPKSDLTTDTYDVANRERTWATDRCPIKDDKLRSATSLHYALGYDSLFGSEAPDLLQMMILVMATTNPGKTIGATIDRMEGKGQALFDQLKLEHPMTLGRENDSCQDEDRRFYESQRSLIKPLYLSNDGDSFYRNIQQQTAPPYVGLGCTRAKLEELTTKNDAGVKFSTSAVGQFRAAVVDYLFQNKMKAEYPNDFQPFLFPESAATLDAVLTPIVEAFNQDLDALQQNLQWQLTDGVPQDKHLTYTSNGLISVKVVSGNQALAQTQSLNYWPQNPTLKLEDFAAALVNAQNTATTAANSNSKSSTSVPAPPLLGGTLSTIIPAIAAFSTAQPQQVTAKVGSGLALTVTPYTLSSARGAELNVNVTYNENAAATISSDTTQSQASDDLNSRVSEHEVNTLVRMDSMKFFEISTMQSVIARQKARYKLIDPVIELPLLDGLGYGVRRRPQVIYNQSIIFLEASIMPTAADLGQGLIYQSDTVLNPMSQKLAVAHSKEAFGTWLGTEGDALSAIMAYHKRMVAYFSGQYIDSSGSVQSSKAVLLPATLSQETYEGSN